MFDPFDLRGPEFLLFYIIIGVSVNMLLRFLLSRTERETLPAHWDDSDPYKIAYLRGGVNEALRVVMISLIDRGLLKASGEQVKAERKAKDIVQRPVEKAVVAFFSTSRDVKDLFRDSEVSRASDAYRHQLADEGLLTDRGVVLKRAPMVLASVGLLVGLSARKIAVAISRGHYNIGLLVMLTVLFVIWSAAQWSVRRTGAGNLLMDRLEGRFKNLKVLAAGLRPGGRTNEVAFLAAIFGVAALPDDYFPYVKKFFPQASAAWGNAGGCGSAGCGSAGCGGGGCGGGGCGGCGGG